MTDFSEKDAANLVVIARRAPLQNMEEAAAVNSLLERFVEFFEAHMIDEEKGDPNGPV